jgi:cell division protein FtsQ
MSRQPLSVMQFLGLASAPVAVPAVGRHVPPSARRRGGRPAGAPVAGSTARAARPGLLEWLGLAEAPLVLEGHPRIRARVLDHVRRRRRRDAVITIGIGTVLAVVLLGIGVVRSPLLWVEDVRIVGVTAAQQQAVADLVGIHEGHNVMDVDLAAVGASVEGLPWVASASVTRRLPSTVEVRVAVRQPVAAAAFGGQLHLLDRAGVVIEQIAIPPTELAAGATGPVDLAAIPAIPVLPEVEVMTAPVIGRPVDDPGVLAATAVADQMPRSLDELIVRYRAGSAGEVDAVLHVPSGDGVVEVLAHLGRPEQVDAKAAALAALIQETIGRGMQPASFDLRIPDRPVVRTDALS